MNMITRHYHWLAISILVVLSCGCDRAGQGSRPAAGDQKQETSKEQLSSAEVYLDAEAVPPGGEVCGRITISLSKGWHTYSDPPGDSGMAPIVDFRLPEGWSVSMLSLPPAKTFQDTAGTTFGYEDQLPIPFILTVPAHAEPGIGVTIETELQWLICRDICVPQSAFLTTNLTVKGQE